MQVQQRFPRLERQGDLPPQTIDRPDDRRGPDVAAHVGDIPPVLEPGAGLLGWGAPFLAGDLMGRAAAVRDDLVGQALGAQAAGPCVFLAAIDSQSDDGGAGQVLLEMAPQREGRRLIVGRQTPRHPLAQPAQAIRLLVGNLAQSRETKRAPSAPHQVVRPQRGA
jgi:hypothetical protein